MSKIVLAPGLWTVYRGRFLHIPEEELERHAAAAELARLGSGPATTAHEGSPDVVGQDFGAAGTMGGHVDSPGGSLEELISAVGNGAGAESDLLLDILNGLEAYQGFGGDVMGQDGQAGAASGNADSVIDLLRRQGGADADLMADLLSAMEEYRKLAAEGDAPEMDPGTGKNLGDTLRRLASRDVKIAFLVD